MPFDKTGRNAISIDQAREFLSLCTTADSAFIAGGYVRKDKALRNAVFLAYDGAIHGTYFKRIRWQNEAIHVGQTGVCFTWKSGFACIPLICADAADNPSPLGTQMMADAIQLGANADTPIVSFSFLRCRFGNTGVARTLTAVGHGLRGTSSNLRYFWTQQVYLSRRRYRQTLWRRRQRRVLARWKPNPTKQ